MGLGGIFDHFQVVLAGDCHDPVHVAGESADVDRLDGTCIFIDQRFYSVGIHLECVDVHIHEYRQSIAKKNGLNGRDVGAGRYQNLIARSHANRVQRRMQRLRARARRQAVFGPDQIGEAFFEQSNLSHAVPLLAQPPAPTSGAKG